VRFALQRFRNENTSPAPARIRQHKDKRIKRISLDQIRKKAGRYTAMALLLTPDISWADVPGASKAPQHTSPVLRLSIAVDQGPWTTHQPFGIHITLENRSNKKLDIATYGAFQTLPRERLALRYGSLLPFEMFDVDFKLTQIKGKQRAAVALIRPVAPNFAPINQEIESLFPGGYLRTTVDLNDWKVANPALLSNGPCELQATWTGLIKQNGSRMNVTTSSNVLRIELRN
jgi:hypothetical protein